ncbi:MAG: hypothetical protein ACE5LU_06230 [Anaerolineae bacterium]
MRRPVAIFAALAVTLALLALSRHLLLITPAADATYTRRAVLLTASSWSASKVDLRTAIEDATYTASADYTLAVPAIDLGDGWQTTLQIQNTGQVATSARIEFFSAADTECPATREPMAVHCIGPIPAGAVHTFDIGNDPTLAAVRSAIVHSAQPEEAGCGSIAGEPLAMLVRRTWVDNGEAPQIASSTYVGIAPAVAGFWDADQEAYVTVIPWVETSDTSQTTLYLQNISLQCTGEIELKLLSGPRCLPMQGTLPAIPPGHSLRVNMANEFADDFSGSVWIRSPQPLAVMVDRWLDDGTLLSTHATGRGAGHQTIDAPLILQDNSGWNATLRNQNVSARFPALVEMTYRTSEITPTLESESFVCLGGSVSIDTGTVTELASPFTGTVALRSLGLDPEQSEVPPLAADIDLLHAGGGAAYHAPNRITGTLSTPDLALPWLTRAYHPVTATPSLTYTSRIAVVNQSEAGDGFVSLAFYDPDGSLTTYQPETPLGPRAMRMIDLADVSDLPAGWHGSAVLQFLSTQPGASVAVAVLDTAPGAPGDAATAYAGIVTSVQAQPTPTPAPTPTATAMPEPTATPTAPQPTSVPDTYLPLLRR